MPETFCETLDVEFASYLDHVATVRNSCDPMVFEWPAQSRTFDDTIAAALETCPPGCMVVVRNARDPPKDWYRRTKVATKFEASEEIKNKLKVYNKWLDEAVYYDMRKHGECYFDRVYDTWLKASVSNDEQWRKEGCKTRCRKRKKFKKKKEGKGGCGGGAPAKKFQKLAFLR